MPILRVLDLHQAVTGAAACRQDVKELKVRPGTDVHDYEVRLRAAQKFLAKVCNRLQH